MASRREQTRKKAHLSTDSASLVTDEVLEDLLVFQLAGEPFGLRLNVVAEIIRSPSLAHMPLVPPSLLGLANRRGVVMPVVSLRALLHLPDVATDRSTRVIVVRGDNPVGFVVDGIRGLLAVATGQLEKDDAGIVADGSVLLDGVIKGAEGDSPIKLLSPSRLLHGQFVWLGTSSTPTETRTSLAKSAPTGTPAKALISLLSFNLGQQEYALPINRVREIIPLPAHVSELPRPENAVLGVVTLRDSLLPLVSLRTLLGLPIGDQHGPRGKVVVMSIGEGAVGIVIDATREILRLDPDMVDPAPTLLTRGDGDAEITSICRLDGGRRLVALLSPDRLFRSELVQRILDEQAASEPGLQAETNAMADEQFIIFRLGNQDYGIPIAAVSEIARPPEHITRLPKSPAFIDGVMNLRGSVVPVVDLRRRFDLNGTEQLGSRRILVLTIGGVTAGFLVDSVSKILKVPIDAICPAPELSPEQMRLISRLVNLEASGQLILLVDPAQLLDQVEADLLAKFTYSKLNAPVTVS
ncbi:MAG: chemotaxis protein CheW [Bradyrhizobium sp.]|nr:chemotaxis protein CheW [Bradyrhizobium sp.]